MQPDSRLWNRAFFLCLRLVFCFGATNRDRLRPIATFSAPCLLFRRDQSRPIATDCDFFGALSFVPARPIATNRDRLRPIATNRDQSRPIATDCDQSRPIATDCDRLRPIATDCDQSRPIATESGGPPPPFFGRRPALDPRSLNFFATHCAFLQKFCFFCHPLRFFTKMWGGWVESHKKLL